MTTEGAAPLADATVDIEDAPLHCYRHPERVTRILCGRCERPICTRCAIQGPVGFRCKQCGTLANDPMTSLNAGQVVLALAVSFGLAAVAGIVASRIGLFGIVIGFFAGGFIAEAVTRVIGIKHGPRIATLVIGGIIAGSLVGFGVNYWVSFMQFGPIPDEIPAEILGAYTNSFVLDSFIWVAVTAGAECVGAYARLR